MIDATQQVFNKLKYLPIRVSPEYFQALPEPVLSKLVDYLEDEYFLPVDNRSLFYRICMVFDYYASYQSTLFEFHAMCKKLETLIISYES